MSTQNNEPESGSQHRPPTLLRDKRGSVDNASLADVIQWFLDYDQRTSIIKHPKVEELFQWKQAEDRRADENLFLFNRAEDRLAIGIAQAVTEHADERELHDWISQLLQTLDEATKANEEIAAAYQLQTGDAVSPVTEAAKIPAQSGRTVYLTYCWLEALCTAEARVLGWLYQEMYGRIFHPDNFR
ncbi:MAG: hypothetical protein QOF02_509 [Blastocatellia bacterium]|jgi:hypothetical protein|nr:hypothetical protein [Blastocatellia bacterium]